MILCAARGGGARSLPSVRFLLFVSFPEAVQKVPFGPKIQTWANAGEWRAVVVSLFCIL
jgi:hypothetical protein